MKLMENKNLTAVEWLWEQVDMLIPYQDETKARLFTELKQQAKQLEHAQRVDDYTNGYIDRNKLNFQPPTQHHEKTN